MSVRATLVGLLIGSVVLGCGASPRSSPALPLMKEDRLGRWLWLDAEGEQCAFPSEADSSGIDAANVKLRVLVGANGSPQAVQTLEDPGMGFGTAATSCAMARRYAPARDEQGHAVSAWTAPISIRFVR